MSAIAAAAGLAGGCSLVFHVDAAQCDTTGDCLARGSAFAHTQCQAGTCVALEALESGTADASDSSTTEAGVVADTGSDADADASGHPCNTYLDCPIPTGNHAEVTCDPDTHACVQLTTDQCPLAYGDYKYHESVGPVVIGAFSPLPANGSDLSSHPCTASYMLAIDEFTKGRSGISAGPNSKQRMPVIVVCDTTSSEIDQSMQHLVGDLNVPAVIAALPSADLKALFDNYGYGQPANVFVVNPFGADSTLTALTRGQQFWHMLGAPGDTAPVYQPLLARVEAYVRTPSSTLSTTSQPWGLGSGSLRVAAVTANATVLTDLASAVLPTLSWNHGSDQAISGDSNFDSEKISDSVLNSSSASPDVSAAVAGILAFQPHVIVSFASDEFVTLLQTVEIKWPNSVPWKPVWILSPYNFQNAGLVVWANSLPAKLSRLVGVNVASTTNSVTANYNTNFVAANPTLSTDFNNCYDATYFAVDSLVAASNLTTRPFAGDDLGQGMLRLISVAGTPYDMGSGDIDHVSASLTTSSNASIELIGTLGDPIFSTQTGARITQGDVYCLEVQPPSQGGGAPSTVYVPDAMRLVVPGDGGVPTLTGTPCFSGL